MKYELEVDGQAKSIELEDRGGRILAEIGGRAYDIQVDRPEDGIVLLSIGNKTYEAVVWQSNGEPNKSSYGVKLRGRTFRASIADRKHRRVAAEKHESGQQALTAP